MRFDLYRFCVRLYDDGDYNDDDNEDIDDGHRKQTICGLENNAMRRMYGQY